MKKGKYMIPCEFLAMNANRTKTGRIYWTHAIKKKFCKIYLGIDIKEIDKNKLHNLMYDISTINSTEFNSHGLPVWKYTEQPIMVSIYK